MTHKLEQPCQVFIEQEIQEGLKQGKTPYSIGKELSAWVEKLFNAVIPSGTIEQRARRNPIFIGNPKLTTQEQEEIQVRKPGKGSPGEPRKYQPPTPKSTFNRTNDSIEWALWTWNPVTGCKHGCPYCYARDIANRFYPPEIGFNPHFWPERLEAPKNMTIPAKDCSQGEKTVFVCSMADLFGNWVPQEQIDQILLAVGTAPEWNFLFLTKNPKRYLTINFPKNAWIGATADTQERAEVANEVFYKMAQSNNRPTVMFLSMEPLSEEIILPEPIPYDWLIIGGQSPSSGAPAMQPEWRWVESLLWQARNAGIKIYFKPNLTIRPREYPNEL